jgi:hypothetical protein
MPIPGGTSFGPACLLAALACLCAGELRAQNLPPSSGWTFGVSPYAWAPSIKGDFRYSVPSGSGSAAAANVDMSSTNVLSNLNGAAMIAAQARYGRFSVSTDFIYLNLGGGSSTVRSVDLLQVGRNPVSSGLNAGTSTNIRGTLWGLDGGYTLLSGGWGHLDAYAGFRLFSVEANTDVRLSADVTGPDSGRSLARTARLRGNTDLFDGIAGVRGRIELGRGFHLPYGFDIGGGSSRLTWQASGGVAYQTGWAGVTLGYRHLYYDQGSDKLVQDLSFSGPFLALNMRF